MPDCVARSRPACSVLPRALEESVPFCWVVSRSVASGLMQGACRVAPPQSVICWVWGESTAQVEWDVGREMERHKTGDAVCYGARSRLRRSVAAFWRSPAGPSASGRTRALQIAHTMRVSRFVVDSKITPIHALRSATPGQAPRRGRAFSIRANGRGKGVAAVALARLSPPSAQRRPARPASVSCDGRGAFGGGRPHSGIPGRAGMVAGVSERRARVRQRRDCCCC